MEMDTPGGVIRGYCATGRWISAIPPISVIATDRTVAKIGRSMKNREITASSLSLRISGRGLVRGLGRLGGLVPGGRLGERRHRNAFGSHFCPRPDLQEGPDHDPVVRLEPVRDDPQPVLLQCPGRDPPLLDLVVPV